MNLLEAVARWYSCDYGDPDRCGDCVAYIYVDPRTEGEKGIGPGTTGQRTLCSLLGDLELQVMEKTNDARLNKEA
jgi:hypothetical protein